jgi:hypothetical protein
MPLSFEEARAAAGTPVSPKPTPATDNFGKPVSKGIDFDVSGAKAAGYSEDEIAAAIAERANFDKDAAEKAGYSPSDIINFLVPAAKGQQQAAELGGAVKETFGRDPSKAGQLTKADYLNRAIGGAVAGGAIGGTVGLVTGPGAIVTGTVGAISGAVSGLLEAGAEDLGFGPGTQMLAGMVTPGAGLSTKVGQMIEKKAAENTARFAGMAAKQLTGIPGIGTVVKKGAEFLESKKPVNVAAIEDVLGIEGKAAKVAQTAEEKSVEATAMRQNIASRFEQTTGTKIPEGADAEKYIYGEAATAINKAQEPFVGSSFFNRAATLEGKVNPAQANKYKKLFQDAEGNPLSGADVLTNLRDFKYGVDLSPKTTSAARDLRWAEGQKLEKEFNGWLMKQPTSGNQPWEAHARGAFEQVAMNKAKDALPSLFQDIVKAEGTTDLKAAAGALERQIWNLSKTPEGQDMFLKQFVGNLKNIPAKDARTLWNRIGPEVERRIITDPQKFKQVSAVMENVQTPQDVNRAVRLINGILTAGAISGMRNL